MLRNVGVFVIIILISGFIPVTAQNEEFQQLYMEYIEITQKLQAIQEQALEDENVERLAEGYSDLVDEKLGNLDPRAGELVDERDKTIDLFQNAQEQGDMETIQHLQEDYQRISRELQPFFEQVMMDPEVREKRDEFETALITKMVEIDSEVEPMMERMDKIAEELDRQMQQP